MNPTNELSPVVMAAGDSSVPGVLLHHLAQLRDRGLTDSTIIAAGIKSETNRDRLQSMLGRKRGTTNIAPALTIPYIDVFGNVAIHRVRPDTPVKLGGSDRPAKYLSPINAESRAYFPPGVAEYVNQPQQELIITEGEFKALAATQEGFPCIGIQGIWNWKASQHERLIDDLERVNLRGRSVFIAFDSDIAEKPEVQDAECRLAAQLANRGARVLCVRIPAGEIDANGKSAKQGLDDYLVAQGVERKRAFRKLLDEAVEPLPVDPGVVKVNAKALDPATEAAKCLAASERDGERTLVFHRGEFHQWSKGRYVPLQNSEVKGRLVLHLNQGYHHLTTSITGNVLDQLRAQSLLSFGHSAPCWIGETPEGWHPDDVLVAQNGIVSLPRLVANQEFLKPATPRFFTPTALDFNFDINAPEPRAWLDFLGQLWGADRQSIEAFQEWFGYCLTNDTTQQKMLVLIGPRRSGKGTIARVMRSVLGDHNVAGPTLASFGTNFGLWPLLGKTAAIISDARLSGRTDQAVVTERLLSISGEDALTVDRKNLEPVTTKLLTRLMILSNELPRLGDSSGALSGRMLLLRLTQSFYGNEDTQLTSKLLNERAGILLWAIQGWARLRERGHFIQPDDASDLREQMEDIASPVAAFVRERCVIGPGQKVLVHDLFREWKEWCHEANREPGQETTFGKDLVAAFPNIKKIRPRIGDQRQRGYEGIGLTRS